MPAITRYILTQVIAATLFVTVALTFAVWLTQSLRLIDYIVNRGLPASTFFQFVGYLLPSFLGIVLPIATFVAVLFVYHKMSMDSEMVVLRSAGLSQLQLAKPALILAVGVTLVVFFITLFLLPYSFREFKDLQHRIRNDVSAALLQEGVFNNISRGITVYLRNRSGDGQLQGILVHDTRDRQRAITMMAETGALVPSESGPRVVMQNGNRQELDRKTGRLSILYFDNYTVELSQLKDGLRPRWREPKERYLPELFKPDNSADDQKYKQELIAEGHHRLVGPLYTLAFALIGLASMLSGEFNRRGQVKRVITAVLCVSALEAVSLALHDLAGRLPNAVFAMYATVFAAIGISLFVLLRRPRLRRLEAPDAAAAAEGGI